MGDLVQNILNIITLLMWLNRGPIIPKKFIQEKYIYAPLIQTEKDVTQLLAFPLQISNILYSSCVYIRQ